jgi:glycosyl transferase family 25
MKQFPAWVLSLADADERRRGIKTALQGCACLSWKFEDAVDGRHGKPIEAPYEPRLTECWQGYRLTAGEIACVEGHRRMWTKFLAGEDPLGMFLEDDIRIDGNFCEMIAAAASHASSDWDVLRLECVWPRRVLRRGSKLQSGEFIVTRRHDCRGSAAYMLTRRAAERLLACTDPFWLPIDVIIDRYWDHELRVRTLDPLPCRQAAIASDIGARHKPRYSFLVRCRREAVRALDLCRRLRFHLSGKAR